MKLLERIFERILWEARLLIVLAVISSVLAAVILLLFGTYDILTLLGKFLQFFLNPEDSEKFHKEVIIRVISALDFFLISTILFIFGLGLYELFISKIEHLEKDTKSSKILVVHSLDQLKDKLGKVIIMLLVVTFFKHAISIKYEEIMNLLYLSVGIALISLALYFLAKEHNGEK